MNDEATITITHESVCRTADCSCPKTHVSVWAATGRVLEAIRPEDCNGPRCRGKDGRVKCHHARPCHLCGEDIRGEDARYYRLLPPEEEPTPFRISFGGDLPVSKRRVVLRDQTIMVVDVPARIMRPLPYDVRAHFLLKH